MKILKKRWKKKQVKKIVKDLVGEDTKVKFVSKERIYGYAGFAYPNSNKLFFGARVFDEGLIWHECGHLLFKEAWDTSRVNCEYFTQLRIIQLALDKGRIRLAKEMIQHMDESWVNYRTYNKARKKIVSYLNV